jgi:integrase/recombinase XerD
MAAIPAPDVGFTRADELVVCAVGSAYLGGVSGETRLHAESDLSVLLRWCPDQEVDPPAAARIDIERHLRWLRDIRHHQPSTVSRRLSVAVGFY